MSTDPAPQPVRRMRSDAELDHMLRTIQARPIEADDGPADPHSRGAIAVLLWVLGRREESPVIGRVLGRRPTYVEIGREAYEANEAFYNPSGRTAYNRDFSGSYLMGVDRYASWITGSDEVGTPPDWPFPAEPPEWVDPQG